MRRHWQITLCPTSRGTLAHRYCHSPCICDDCSTRSMSSQKCGLVFSACRALRGSCLLSAGRWIGRQADTRESLRPKLQAYKSQIQCRAPLLQPPTGKLVSQTCSAAPPNITLNSGTPCDLTDPSVAVAWQWVCDSFDVVCQFCCIKSKSGRPSPAKGHAADCRDISMVMQGGLPFLSNPATSTGVGPTTLQQGPPLLPPGAIQGSRCFSCPLLTPADWIEALATSSALQADTTVLDAMCPSPVVDICKLD